MKHFMIRLVPVVAGLIISAAFELAAADAHGEFRPIFDGKSLDGWDGNPKFWSVEDGAITGRTTAENPTQGNTFLIWRQGNLDDFELRLKYRIVNGNSGIQYRSKDLGGWVVGGYQADFEAGTTYSGILYEEKGRGILAQRGQKTTINDEGKVVVNGSLGESKDIQALIKQEDWNDYLIIARGNRMTHVINGRVTADVTDDQPDKRAFSGILALQLHAGPPMTVQFKDLQLKRLPLGSRKKVVLVAGRPSHGRGSHEHNAGVQLLDRCLQANPDVLSTYYLNGWPKDPTAFDNADTVMLFMDGGGGHPAIQGNHLDELGAAMNRGAGLVNVHYAVEVPKDKGGPQFLDWVGGYFEAHWSVNPHWTAEFKQIPKHPITTGVEPFSVHDEWYYHMRFREDMAGLTPILTALPPPSTLERPDGAHSGNPHVRAKAGQPHHVAWAYQRPDGGRGFGFTGAHFHKNWGNPNFRKIVLNALLWTAQAEVPAGGVACEVTADDLEKNLD